MCICDNTTRQNRDKPTTKDAPVYIFGLFLSTRSYISVLFYVPDTQMVESKFPHIAMEICSQFGAKRAAREEGSLDTSPSTATFY